MRSPEKPNDFLGTSLFGRGKDKVLGFLIKISFQNKGKINKMPFLYGGNDFKVTSNFFT